MPDVSCWGRGEVVCVGLFQKFVDEGAGSFGGDLEKVFREPEGSE